ATSPSNAHAYRLYVVNDPRQDPPVHCAALSLPNLAAISEALDYDRVLRGLSTLFSRFVCDSLWR
ncbi:hypothetical protein, partial [Ramlibacter monticola]